MRGRHRVRTGLAIGCWVALVGCGGSSTGGADTTGPGTGGSAAGTGSAGGTGGASTTVPSQGALYVTVSAPSGGASSCPVSSAYNAPAGASALTAIRDHGGEDPNTGEIYREVDGVDSATIACKVSVANEGANVDVDLSFKKAQSVAFAATGNITASGGTLHIVEWDNQTGQTLEGDCTVATHVVQQGVIWATFDCPSFSDGALVECAASGAMVFENCER